MVPALVPAHWCLGLEAGPGSLGSCTCSLVFGAGFLALWWAGLCPGVAVGPGCL